MERFCSYVKQTYCNAFGLKKSNALVGSSLMSHLPRATLVNMEDGYSHRFLLHWQLWQEDSTYFSLFFFIA